jgi:murein DD-endopeptidase MepM/ murein hydrolase activator NlpD
LSLAGHRRLPGALRTARVAILAASVLALVGPVPALAGTPDPGLSGTTPRPTSTQPTNPTSHKPEQPPEPRVMKPGEASGFRLPFKLGTSATVEQGWNTSFSHNGKAAYAYDFAVPLGTPVVAAADGVVSYVHDGERACGGAELLMKANIVVIDHADGSATQYGHLSTIGVKEGQAVLAGQQIGTSGDTGYSQCLPHLHFARQAQGGAVTQSVPIYFQGYASQEFHDGDVVTPPAAPCPAPTPEGKVAGHPSTATFCGAYYAGAFDGPATFTRSDAFLNFDWRTRGPGGYWLDDASLPFSARWSGDFTFASAGQYTVGVIAAGGVIVSIDGVRVVDRWVDDGQPTNVVLTQVFGAGVHRIDVDYLSTAGHGLLKVGWGRFFADE